MLLIKKIVITLDSLLSDLLLSTLCDLVVDGPGLRDIPGLETGLLKIKIKYLIVNGPGV